MNIQKLLLKALKSDVKTHKLAAFAFTRSGRLLSSSVNLRGSGRCSSYSVHAEEALIAKLHNIRARERLGKLSVVVLRLCRKTKSRAVMARPCNRCELLLRHYGIEDIQYSDNDGILRRL